MRFSINYISILFLSFIILLFIFYIFYKSNLKLFIGKLNNTLYIFSSMICVIGFLITFLYICLKNNFNEREKNDIFIYILLIIISTTLWIPSSYYKMIYFNILFLLLLCLSNFFLLFTLINIHENKYIILHKISIISVSYLLFHHFFIDLIMWTYYNYL